MNKRALHHTWRYIRPLRPWHLLVVVLSCAVISGLALRQNNLTAIRLRDEVLRADQQNGDVESALRRLREHVHAHMNSHLASGPNAIRPPIQLKYRYERLVAAEEERVKAINARIYTDAQADCERRFPAALSGAPRVACIQQYVTSHGVQKQSIPEGLSKFDFVSPAWSPDLAGLSLVASLLAFLLFLMRLFAGYWIRKKLR